MSKQTVPGKLAGNAEQQIYFLASQYRSRVRSTTFSLLEGRVRELGLHFSDEELLILAALDTPAKVQEFLNTQIYYNNDHASPGMEETAMSPRSVLQTAHAHCFEGAMFAYAVNFLHGHNPRLILLEASQDSEHNLVLFEDPETKLYGVNAHSAFPHLDGRLARYTNIRDLAESYYPHYYSDRTFNPRDLTLVGYSDPFDLIPKHGTEWMASEDPLWDIYYTFIDDTVTFHYLFDDSRETHLYPLIRALKEQWIQIDVSNRPFVDSKKLPLGAQELWDSFRGAFDSKNVRPRGRALEIEKQFQKLTGTTPLDLEENAEELRRFLERGYRIEQLLTR